MTTETNQQTAASPSATESQATAAAAAQTAAAAAQTAAAAAREAAADVAKVAATAQKAAAAATGAPPRHPFWSQTLPHFVNILSIILSFGLIAFISFDTFRGVDYLENPLYMKYQFYVCIIFLIEYLYRFITSEHKLRYFFFSLPFLLIAIPYLNIIEQYNIQVDHELLRYICFVPIVRGMVAQVMVVNYVSENLASTVFVSYLIVLVPFIYMSGLIFYVAEKAVNPAIENFWNALWWAGMNASTVGCYINPATPIGKVLSLILSLVGLIMFPLFTVYFGQMVTAYNNKLKGKPAQ
ncbi:MAG: two pore domain potassium channel family protein [Desulfovibrio sp.]|uniref:potassium channel family protein n=1 Tax=Desulfovibrio sp. TaxID=885 RepID=UPI001A6AB99A|nr:potassium channel family protein [Desulfovibrio sp.]MBD5416486.1 two pore domain potassium channel family protein [Desulfovibrio sp.]